MKKLLFVVILCVILMGFVSADQIFSDDFESGGLSGWGLTSNGGANWVASTLDPLAGSYHAQAQPLSTSEPASVMERTISTAGYKNITLRYNRKLIGLDTVDWFSAEWYDGNSWHEIERKNSENGAYVLKEFNLSSSADNKVSFMIKFECTAGATSEYCRVDNVEISGILIDINGPAFSNYTENPANGSIYSQGQNHEFNVTVNDASSISKVWIEFEGVNYTNGNITNASNIYLFNIYNLVAGVYSYKWFANDSLGNLNNSGMRYYTIAKASQTATLNINETSPMVYGTYINVTCNGELFRNDVNVTNEKSHSVMLGAGSYDYSCKLYESQNYNYDDDNLTFVVNKAISTTSVLVSPLSPITYGTASNFSCSNSVGLSNVLYINGINSDSQKGFNVIRGAGSYDVNCTSMDNQNYTGSSEQVSYRIDKAIGSASLTNSFSWTVDYGTSTTRGYSESNSGDGDVVYEVYRDGVYKGSGESVLLGAGSYNYLLNTTGGQNYSAVSSLDSEIFVVNKASPVGNMLISITPSNSVSYGTQTSAIGSETNAGDGDLTYSLFRNGAIVSNPNTEALNAGTYEYIYNTTGGQNYTNGTINSTLIVGKMANPVSLLLNGQAGNITIQYPQQINVSAYSPSGSISLFRNGINVNSDNGINVTLSSGFYEYYANSSGNTNYLANSSGIILYVNITEAPDVNLPEVEIIHPLSGSSFGYNESISLNYSAFDLHLDSCWYTIDNGENVSLSLCTNSTFDVPEGMHLLRVYANDSSGNIGSDITSFNVQIGAPTINVISPGSRVLGTGSLNITYSATDLDGIGACELYADFNGNYELYSVNSTVVSGVNSYFGVLGLSDNSYIYSISCNDSFGEKAYSSNYTFVVDTVSPRVQILQPNGGKSSRTGIPISFSASDLHLDSCWYNIYRGAVVEVSNTTINCTLGTGSFDVTLDADFVLNFFVNDSAGNQNSSSSSFSVSTAQPPSPSEGENNRGGGGGSAFVSVINRSGLKIEGLGDLIMKPGESRTLEITLRNTGNTFLNKCRLFGKGQYSSWFYSDHIRSIGLGEIVEYVLTVKSPSSATENDSPEFSVECMEKSFDFPVNIIILETDLSFDINGMRLLSNEELQVNYSYFGNVEDEQRFSFRVYDSDDLMLSEKIESLNIKNDKTQGSIVLDVSLAESGLLKIVIARGDAENSLVEEFFVYEASRGITGFIMFDNSNGDRIYWVVIAMFLALAIAIVRRIIKFKRQGGYMHASDEPLLNKVSLSKSVRHLRKGIASTQKKSEKGAMIVDHKFIGALKEFSKGKDVKGKWISVSLDKKGKVKSS